MCLPISPWACRCPSLAELRAPWNFTQMFGVRPPLLLPCGGLAFPHPLRISLFPPRIPGYSVSVFPLCVLVACRLEHVLSFKWRCASENRQITILKSAIPKHSQHIHKVLQSLLLSASRPFHHSRGSRTRQAGPFHFLLCTPGSHPAALSL